MKEPKVTLGLEDGVPIDALFVYTLRDVISHCNSPTKAYIKSFGWKGRYIIGVVEFAGGETPAERRAVMDNVVLLCEAARGV